MMDPQQQIRYARQMIVPGFGEAGQEKLRRARVLVVGAGGLGSAALSYLAAGGVGELGIVEFDVVEPGNLQRQILYTVRDLGHPKAAVAARRLTEMNPDLRVVTFAERFTGQNAGRIAERFDLVVDCTDNYPARYAIDAVCGSRKIPMVYGSAQQGQGQVGVFHAGHSGSYSDLYPPSACPPEDGRPVGVLSPLPGLVGSIQALEAVKLITGYGDTLAGKLLTIDAKTLTFSVFELPTG